MAPIHVDRPSNLKIKILSVNQRDSCCLRLEFLMNSSGAEVTLSQTTRHKVNACRAHRVAAARAARKRLTWQSNRSAGRLRSLFSRPLAQMMLHLLLGLILIIVLQLSSHQEVASAGWSPSSLVAASEISEDSSSAAANVIYVRIGKL